MLDFGSRAGSVLFDIKWYGGRFLQYLLNIKLAAASAGVFYVTVCAAIFIPTFRAWIYDTLRLPSPATQSHLDPLDAFRAIAALWVACGHLYQWPAPTFNASAAVFPLTSFTQAVPLFCVLSGMLIYRSLTKRKGKATELSDLTLEDLRRYTKRRFLRVYPLFAFCVLLTFVLFPSPPNTASIDRLIYELSGLHTLALQAPFTVPTSWSLYVEFLFYAVVPVYAVSIRRHPISASICTILILCLSDAHMAVGATQPFNFVIVASLGLWKFFVFGILASELYDLILRRNLHWIGLPLLAVAIVLFYVSLSSDWFTMALNAILKFFGQPRLPNSIFTFGYGFSIVCLILGALFCKPVNKILSLEPLRVLGAISYSTFLIHAFVIYLCLGMAPDWMSAYEVIQLPPPAPAWVPFAIMVPTIIVWASVTFIYVEKPFLQLRSGSGQEREQSYFRGLALAFAPFAGLLIAIYAIVVDIR
jgi:peptidoglycan/LPS O-acetylase OafA/YrhL